MVMPSPLTVVLDCLSSTTICNYNRGINWQGRSCFTGLPRRTTNYRKTWKVQLSCPETAAGWPLWSAADQQALNGRLLLQEAFRAWQAFFRLRSQGCFSKDFQVLLSSWQWLVDPIQAPSQVAGIPGHQHQMTNRQEQGSSPRKKKNRIRFPRK